ncbi:MAG: hypothetical protein LBC02_02385, partial [Planctomycetaceae bacterium]|nr:hypothetical protein [Planctomycetaceae bacterium]
YVFSKKQTALERFFCPRFPLDRKHLREELLKDETPTPDKSAKSFLKSMKNLSTKSKIDDILFR